MIRRLLPLLLLFAARPAAAQLPDDEYYPYAGAEEREAVLQTDSALFYRAVQTVPDLYGEFTSFGLPSVSLARRGERFSSERASVEGLALTYRYFTALRLLGAEENRYAGIQPSSSAAGGAGGMREFRFTDDQPLLPFLASVRFSDRNYLFGARFTASKSLPHGWRLSLAADARTGRDMHVQGVFTNALTAGFRLARRLGEGHEVALLAVVPPSVRGTRLSSVEEAFELTGDRLYNPAWGYHNGKVRNSRVRREVVPLAAVTYRVPLSASTSLAAAFGAEIGVEKYSSPGWYDARTPMPDNYRNLPSFTGDRETERAWRSGDARYTQIDWDRLVRTNRRTGGEAVYTLEDRAEGIRNLHFDAQATTTADVRLTLRYGVYYSHSTTRSYKQMRDLLGASYLIDTDQYIEDDETYGSLRENDLRHPGRVIGTGDRFAYDYALTTRSMGVRFGAEYRADRFRADFSAELGDAAVFRRGYYEKELFPGEGSFGLSRRMRFTPYTFSLSAGWAFSPRSYLGFTGMAAAVLPRGEDLFFQPLYNNRTVDRPVPERIYAATADYALTGSVAELRVTAFVSSSLDGVRTQRYYDDLSAVYADMAVRGIGRLNYGLEAAASVRLAYRWRLSLAASAGRYRYSRDPVVTLLSDVDNTVLDQHATSRMGGCRAGGAPQFTAFAEGSYFGPKGWGVRLSGGYAGGRWVEPMPLRRTDRIAGQGGTTPEAFDAFTSQERLPDAFTLDASVFKTFYFAASRLTAALMLRNLTGSTSLYSAYESLRIRRLYAGEMLLREPQTTRYTNAYPRSVYLTVSYRF